MGAILKERDYVGIVLGVLFGLAALWLCWWALTTSEKWKAVLPRRRGEGAVADETGVEMRDLERGGGGSGEREGGRVKREEGVEDGEGPWMKIAV